MKTWSSNHWTTREFPQLSHLKATNSYLSFLVNECSLLHKENRQAIRHEFPTFFLSQIQIILTFVPLGPREEPILCTRSLFPSLVLQKFLLLINSHSLSSTPSFHKIPTPIVSLSSFQLRFPLQSRLVQQWSSLAASTSSTHIYYSTYYYLASVPTSPSKFLSPINFNKTDLFATSDSITGNASLHYLLFLFFPLWFFFSPLVFPFLLNILSVLSCKMNFQPSSFLFSSLVNFNFNHNFNDIHKLMTINVCLQFQIVRYNKYWLVSSFGYLYRHFIISMSKPNLFLYFTLPSVFYHLVKREVHFFSLLSSKMWSSSFTYLLLSYPTPNL